MADATAQREGEIHLLELIAADAPLSEVLERLTRFIESQAPGMLCSVLLLDEDGEHVRHGAAPSLPEAYNRAVDGHAIGPAAGSCGTAMYRREPVIVTDVRTDPLWASYQHLGLPPELRACWSTPILARGGRVLGSFAMYYPESRGPTDDERRLFDVATHLAGIAIERSRERRALRESEERFRTLVEHAAYGIFRSTPAGRFLAVNRALVDMLGYDSAAEVLALDIPTEVYADPVGRERAVAAGERKEYVKFESVWKRRDGTTFPVRLTGRTVRAGGGRVESYETIAEDVTQWRTLEDRLRQSQKLEAIGQLAGGLAHDFNNLLTAIIGYCDLLLDSPDPLTNWRSDLGEILGAARRATALTRKLLAFGRKQILNPEVLEVNALLAGVARMLERLIGEDVELVVELDPAVGCVRTDPAQLEQVVINLAVNARDAMPGGGQITVRTAILEVTAEAMPADRQLVAPGSYVVITVTDTGHGMDEATQAHIFEPFFSTKPRGEGSGLGLATVYGTVKQSGGYIWVDSASGQGTAFEIYLPRVPGRPSAELEVLPESRAGRGESVLLVEDDPIVRSVVRAILESRNYRVVAAEGPEAALAAAASLSEPIDLILTDVVMPAMSGPALVERLMPMLPGAKVLYMSGYADGAVMRHGVLEAGAAFLQKPFTSAELARKSREVLDAG